MGRLVVMSLETSSSESGVNSWSVAAVGMFCGGEGGSQNCLLMFATFSVKKVAKLSGFRSVVAGGGGGLSSDLNVENSLRESVVLLILSL